MKHPAELGGDHAQKFAARSPRLAGAFVLVLGFVAVSANLALIAWIQRYFGALFVLGGALTGLGLWILITGRTNSADSPKPPLWWTIGILGFALAGAAAGFYLITLLKQ